MSMLDATAMCIDIIRTIGNDQQNRVGNAIAIHDKLNISKINGPSVPAPTVTIRKDGLIKAASENAPRDSIGLGEAFMAADDFKA